MHERQFHFFRVCVVCIITSLFIFTSSCTETVTITSTKTLTTAITNGSTVTTPTYTLQQSDTLQEISDLPFSDAAIISTLNSDAYYEKYGHQPTIFPLSEFGIHISKAFWIELSQITKLTIISDFPAAFLDNVHSNEEAEGKLLFRLEREYVHKAWAGGYSQTMTLVSSQKIGEKWETVYTFRVDATDFPAPYVMTFANYGTESCSFTYNISIESGGKSVPTLPDPIKISPPDWTTTTDGYQESSFSLPVAGFFTVSVFCEDGGTIEYFWLSDEFIADWYFTPGTIPMMAGGYEEPVQPPVDINGDKIGLEIVVLSKDGGQFGQSRSDHQTIKAEGYYRGAGYYTLCLFNNTDSMTNVIFRYRVY